MKINNLGKGGANKLINYVESSKSYAVEPCNSCGLAGGYIGANMVDDIGVLIHGSSGCAFAMRYGLAQHWKSFIPITITNLCENNIIFGSENILEEALYAYCKSTEKKLIIVLSTCSAELIGEDYRSVINSVQENVGKKIIYVETGGSGNIIDGYNRFLFECARELVKCDGRKKEKKKEEFFIDLCGIVPMFDVFWRGDFAEIERIFDLLNIHINSFFVGHTNQEIITSMKNSDAIVAMDPGVGRKACKYLEKHCNIEIINTYFIPIGFKYTGIFIRRIAKLLGVEEKKVNEAIGIEEERTKNILLRGYDFTKVMFQSCKVSIIGPHSWACPMLHFIVNEIGMECNLLCLIGDENERFDNEIEIILKEANYEKDITIYQGNDNYKIRELIKESEPNIVFGRSIDRQKNSNIIYLTWQFPCSDYFLIKDEPIVGYNGIISIVNRIVNALCNSWY